MIGKTRPYRKLRFYQIRILKRYECVKLFIVLFLSFILLFLSRYLLRFFYNYVVNASILRITPGDIRNIQVQCDSQHIDSWNH